jgi:hypothetical protein
VLKHDDRSHRAALALGAARLLVFAAYAEHGAILVPPAEAAVAVPVRPHHVLEKLIATHV